jgi:hypothetical protein
MVNIGTIPAKWAALTPDRDAVVGVTDHRARRGATGGSE